MFKHILSTLCLSSLCCIKEKRLVLKVYSLNSLFQKSMSGSDSDQRSKQLTELIESNNTPKTCTVLYHFLGHHFILQH